MSKMLTVQLVSTGGTLEKVYSEQTGSVHNRQGESAVNKLDRYLRQLRLTGLHVEITPLMNIDSLDMTDEHRARILEVVREKLRPEEPVLITHGTDTMVETGQYLKRGLSALPAPIVMTGAMTPLGFEGSDGLQNLTESLLALRLLPAGIYIVMHNQIFPIDNVRKDRELARFVYLRAESPVQQGTL